MMNIGRLSAATISTVSAQTLGGSLGTQVGKMLGQLQGNMQQLSKMLGRMSTHFRKAASNMGPAQQFQAKPQPFSAVQVNVTVFMNPLGNLAQAGRPAGQPTSFGKAPGVNTEADWPAFNSAVKSRITGSDAAKNGLGFDGNIWTKPGNVAERAAIGWAMQGNDKVRYDADRKQFYVTNADGSTRDVASMQEMIGVMNKAGGASQSNPAAMQAVLGFLDGRISAGGNAGSSGVQQAGGGPGAAGGANGFQQLIAMLQKLVQMLSGQATGAAGGAGAASGVSAGAGAGPSSGASGAGSAAGASGTGSAGGGGGMAATVDSIGSKVDSMMSQAEKLMQSDKQSDQLKGQMMMQRAMRMFEMISKMLEQQSQMLSKAISAVR